MAEEKRKQGWKRWAALLAATSAGAIAGYIASRATSRPTKGGRKRDAAKADRTRRRLKKDRKQRLKAFLSALHDLSRALAAFLADPVVFGLLAFLYVVVDFCLFSEGLHASRETLKTLGALPPTVISWAALFGFSAAGVFMVATAAHFMKAVHALLTFGRWLLGLLRHLWF